MSAFTVEGAQDPPGPGPFAGGALGSAALRPLLEVVLEALASGAEQRGGPLPAGGPERVADEVRATVGAVLRERGTGAREALETLVGLVARGAADPSEPLCAAHLHCPPLALAVAADVAGSAVNPSMDSWDQAPAASELEALVCGELARLVFPAESGPPERGGAPGPEGPKRPWGSKGPSGPEGPSGPDALVTSGGTEGNQLGLLLGREAARARGGAPLRVVCGANAHHSVGRAAWLLGLAPPVVVPTPAGVLTAGALDEELARGGGAPALVVATAGTTDAGDVDPLPELAAVVARHGARWHVDAAYGGPLVFSERLRGRLAGLERADSVAFDLHKLGWQPVAAGVLAVRDGAALRPLAHRAAYLNADDDTEAGLPDLLGRSLRTTRRPDVLKVAVTLRALGRSGLAAMVERTCAAAERLADVIAEDGRFSLYARPPLTTVLFRPRGLPDAVVAAARRELLVGGAAVLGRAAVGGRLWLKVTLLDPTVREGEPEALLKLVDEAVAAVVERGAGADGAVAASAEGERP